MPENLFFPPEGLRPPSDCSLSALRDAVESGDILEAAVSRCGTDRTLFFSLGSVEGRMPRQEAVAPWISGAGRDISVLSRVGKQTCFTVKSISADAKGAPVALLSRREAQEKAMAFFLVHLVPGSVLSCRVIRLEPFGAFLDIGCGIVAILPIEHISVSRISHPGQRFYPGQAIFVVVLDLDPAQERIYLTHRELLGTWSENAAPFRPGMTVPGIVRGIKEYGAFVELAPNLSGLADAREGLSPGDGVSVFIKSIRPERMKVKLQVIEKLPPDGSLPPLRDQITDGRLEHWVYSPPGYERQAIETDFTAVSS